MTTQEYITNYAPDFAGSETVLGTALLAAQASVETYLGRPVANAERTEIRRPAGEVLLKCWPVSSIAQITDEAGKEITEYRLIGATGELRLDEPFTGELTVIYTGGYDPVPADINLAIALSAGAMLQSIETGGQVIASERLGDWSASYASAAGGNGAAGSGSAGLSPAAMALLEPYRSRRA